MKVMITFDWNGKPEEINRWLIMVAALIASNPRATNIKTEAK